MKKKKKKTFTCAPFPLVPVTLTRVYQCASVEPHLGSILHPCLTCAVLQEADSMDCSTLPCLLSDFQLGSSRMEELEMVFSALLFPFLIMGLAVAAFVPTPTPVNCSFHLALGTLSPFLTSSGPGEVMASCCG